MRKFKFTKKSLIKIINSTNIFDIHTHLFPSSHLAKDFYLSGLDDLLNYHYLTSEYLSASKMSPKKFFLKTKRKKAELVWNYLFSQNTPISEAARGVIKIFKFLKIKDYQNKPYFHVLRKYNQKKINENYIFKKLNIKKIVMTNNPFNKSEWNLFKDKSWNKNFFKSSLRLDDLFTLKKKMNNEKLKNFIHNCMKISNPLYFAISVDGKNIKKIFDSNYMKKVIFPILKTKKIPIMILIGVKRGVNRNFKEGGDGIGDEDCTVIESIVAQNPDINFLVTHLSDISQYKLIVLSRKFSNLKLFGFWWFLNQKKMIKNILDQKINLLGLNFIAQHSDARVYEQLIYKWINFKEILSEIFYEKYILLQNDGFKISENQIVKDMNKILNPSLENFK